MTKGHCCLLWMLLTGWLVLPIPPLLAQDTEAYQQEVRTLYHQGARLVDKKEYQRALAKFVAALDLVKRLEASASTPQEKQKYHASRLKVLFVIARTYHFASQYLLARDYYRLCLKSHPPAKVAELTKQYLTEILPHLLATLVLDSTPSGAQVTLEDTQGSQRIGRTPLVEQLEPGPWKIRIVAPGHQPYKDNLTLVAKGRLEKRYALQPAAAVSVDRRVDPFLPPVFAHPQRRLAQTLGWTGIGITIVAGVTGAILFAFAQSEIAWVTQARGQLQTSTAEIVARSDQALLLQTGSLICWIAGGALLVTATGLLLWNGGPPPQTATLPPHQEKTP